MSQDSSDKPFAPSHHKLRKARERGEVASINDLPNAFAALAVAILVWLLARWLWQSAQGLVDDMLVLAFADEGSVDRSAMAMRIMGWRVLLCVGPLLLVAAFAGTALKWFLVGPVFSFEPLAPKLQRIDPVGGAKRLFSRDTWVALVKSLLCAGLVGLVLSGWLLSQASSAVKLQPVESLLGHATGMLLTLMVIGLLVLAVIAMADAAYQAWTFKSRMRMDMKDMRDEHRQLEGSPEIKGARKRAHKELFDK